MFTIILTIILIASISSSTVVTVSASMPEFSFAIYLFDEAADQHPQ